MTDHGDSGTLGRAGPDPRSVDRRAIMAWCLYDWANSAVFTVVLTFVFATYFQQAVATDPNDGAAQWGLTLTMSGIAIAVLSVVVGPMADKGGARKPWLGVTTIVAVLACASLWVVAPDPGWIWTALLLIGVVNVAMEVSMVFYNAMLTQVAPPRMVGRVSGWAWGLGYIGGLACLSLALPLVNYGGAWFGLDAAMQEPVRATCVLAALWFALFAAPAFLFVRDVPPTGLSFPAAAKAGLRELGGTLRDLPRHRNLLRFLVAHMIYRDGLNTLFAFGGAFAGVVMGMDTQAIILFGIVINVSAGIGAFAFAFLDDWIGGKRTILIALFGLMALGIPLLVITDVSTFYAVAVGLGTFFGPAQAASRSLMTRLVPPGDEARYFGLYNFSGKAISMLGPAVYGLMTDAFDTQRAGMAALLVFLVVGVILLWRVEEPPRGERAKATAA